MEIICIIKVTNTRKVSKMKNLGFGLMRLPRIDPNDRASIETEKVKAMVDKFIEEGFTYFVWTTVVSVIASSVLSVTAIRFLAGEAPKGGILQQAESTTLNA